MTPSSLRGNLFTLSGMFAASLALAAFAWWVQGAVNRVSADDKADKGAQSAGEQSAKAARRAKYDPIADNGKYFVGWSRPELLLVLTGRQEGYLEPCGCTGIETQKGGLARRYSFLEGLRANKGWPVVALDLGGVVGSPGRQAEIQYETTIQALEGMGYAAVGVGDADLRLRVDHLVQVSLNHENLLLLGNCSFEEFDGLIQPFVAAPVPAGKDTVFVTAVLGKSEHDKVSNPAIKFTPPETALLDMLKEKAFKSSKHHVLLAYMSTPEATALARRPELKDKFEVIVTAGGGDVPPDKPAEVVGATQIIEVGHKGMYAVAIGFYGAGKPLRRQVAAIDSRFPEAPQMTLIATDYQHNLQREYEEWLANSAAGLRLPQTVPHPTAKQQGKFVGAKKCQECHGDEYDIWAKSTHASAAKTLGKATPQRLYDPECLRCHVTGWSVEKAYPYFGGFLTLEKTPLLAGNQCENCHGPGEQHILAENGASGKRQKELRELMRVEKSEKTCLTCHDGENSVDFDFETYWAKIAH